MRVDACGYCGSPLSGDCGYTGCAAYHHDCARLVYGAVVVAVVRSEKVAA